MFQADPGSTLTSSLAVAALAASGAAWLVAAAALVLDLLGRRLPRGRWRENRSRRRVLAVLLATVTGAALAQIAALADWPPPLRVACDAVVMVLAIALMACVLTVASARRPDPGPDPSRSWPQA